jgi:glutathione peroxidase
MNLLMLIPSLWFFTSIYTLSFTDTDGNTVSMSSFQNKKILLVNIATNSPRVEQLTGLQQLKQQYGDSLVVIAFPSNSFGNETRTDAGIKQFCQQNYGVNFVIASKGSVSGFSVQPVYDWLKHTAQNGVMDVEILRDFQKVLINKDGNIIGVFAPGVSPTDSSIMSAITTN